MLAGDTILPAHNCAVSFDVFSSLKTEFHNYAQLFPKMPFSLIISQITIIHWTQSINFSREAPKMLAIDVDREFSTVHLRLIEFACTLAFVQLSVHSRCVVSMLPETYAKPNKVHSSTIFNEIQRFLLFTTPNKLKHCHIFSREINKSVEL